ncbi:DUF4238 domain-containing protein [Streptomyces tendae]|uniref:DUF4238 domain-containing protein n=1 Tax=Streptomyces tendae TaxID=1932 RepID=A0A6B3R1M1_STRTE|nr:DUF4238 domain-containing protein [Streptomyces tendae]
MKATHIARQHLVSQVLLRQFTMPGSGGTGWQLLPIDVCNPERPTKLKGTRACGSAANFVAVDSASVEALWGSVESRAPAALAAVHAGAPFADPLHVETLRDLVVLHYVRSHRYRGVHTSAFETTSVRLRGELTSRFPEQLRREALRRTGLHLTGPGSLGAFAERLIEQSEVAQAFESGKLFRTSIENTFYQVRAMAAKWQVEVLMPESGQFLVGDNPAVTIRTDTTPFSYNMAFGDAHSIVLPISPRHLLALGAGNMMATVPRAVVDEINAVQVFAADRFVYMHPRSGLETFVRAKARQRPAVHVKR